MSICWTTLDASFQKVCQKIPWPERNRSFLSPDAMQAACYSLAVLIDGNPATEVNMSKQLPRPDLMESANVVYHDTIAISSSGFEEAHKKCAKFGKFYRQPCYPISQLPRSEKTQESFTQPGEFNVNLDFVRPRLAANMEFRKRPGRKDLLE